jgi:hypothetical protein
MSTVDQCPAWAHSLIVQLKELEIRLGNIPESLTWQTGDLDTLAARVQGETDLLDTEHDMSETLFRKIVHQLAREDFEPEEIATFINSRVGYKGGPPYCNAAEVRAELS